MSDARCVNLRFTPTVRISSVEFKSLTSREIKKLSCKRITNPVPFDSLLHPTNGGLYDPALGPTDRRELCGTCGLNYIHCPGHMGHISLPLPVFHPIFFPILYQVLQSSCLSCHRLLSTGYNGHVLKGQMKLLDHGLISEALDLECYIRKDSEMDKTDDVDSSITNTINSYIDICMQKAYDSTVYNDRDNLLAKTKHIVDNRKMLIQQFFRSMGSKCPHCKAPVRKIRHEFQNKVILRGMSAKQAGQWVAAANAEKMKRETIEDKIKREEDEEDNMTDVKLKLYNTKMCTEHQYFTPIEAKAHLQQIWDNDPSLMMAICSCLRINEIEGDHSINVEGCGSSPPTDMFFVDIIPVPPSRFRPISSMGEKKYESSQTTNLQKILKDCNDIQELLAEKNKPDEIIEIEDDTVKDPKRRPKQTLNERLRFSWSSLQTDVNTYMDSDINKKIKDLPNGIKQILEKKEGLFRKNMMGKRVNYAARSVISPDPNINMDEIGIPMVFATSLTYPEPVTHWNVHELKQAVINGPNIYPGATHVQNEDGSLILLNPRNSLQRRGLANRLLAPNKLDSIQGTIKIVYRHLKNKDVLLLNRQPTLHKPSIMAHLVRVLPGEMTIRLHYANCKAYNADFDGDEMNIHFPQNELSRSEAYHLVSTHHQYLVPKDGTPLSGLIQDHIVAGVLLTIRGRFFTREDYHKLLFSALPSFTKSFCLLPPSIIKPDRLWSGKQIISTLLLNLIPKNQDKLNLTSKSKISTKEWNRKCKGNNITSPSDTIMTESEVVFRNGQLVCGVLDKSQFGASQFGFVHSCFELYGGEMCNLLLSALGRLFTSFLQLHSFTLGVEDILVTPQADNERTSIINHSRGIGNEAAAEAFAVKDPNNYDHIRDKYEEVHRNLEDNGLKILDYFMKKKTDQVNNRINSVCVPAGLYKPFPDNSLQLMVQAGAKGSTVNCMQISCLLGQIELEGQRPPLMLSGKSLPSFLPYDTSPRAGGFVDGRFLTGIKPQEYVFHCMAGREGLIDTAIKTSRSGYLQRCLIKHLEGITVQYDLSVRDSDGSIIQFLYGEDGLDINKTRFLVPQQLHFMGENYKAMLYQLDPQSAVDALESVKALKYQRKVDRCMKKSNEFPRPRRGGFLDFYEHHLPEFAAKYPNDRRFIEFNNRTKAQRDVIDSWYSSSPMLRNQFTTTQNKSHPPTLSVYRPDRHFGSISEKLNRHVNQYISDNLQQISNNSITKDKFKSLMQFKCLRALADPGEAVGLLAAQSIGEPSTQMTLNTFHFAGRGDMNVTLGIPRLREILMTASPLIKTPSMDVPLLSSPNARAKGERLKKMFTRVLLSDVLDRVEVWESLDREKNTFRNRIYHVKLTFLDHKYYQDDYIITPSLILKFIETVFIKRLVAVIKKEIKKIQENRVKSVGVVKDQDSSPSSNLEEDNTDKVDDDADDDNGESDLSDVDEEDEANKQISKKKQLVSYDDADDEDVEAMECLENNDSNSKGMREKGDCNVGNDSKSVGGASLLSLDDIDDQQCLDLDTQRVKVALSNSPNVTSYTYDVDNEIWCHISLKFSCVDTKIMLASLIEGLSKKVIVWEIPNIKKGFLVESQVPGEDNVLRLKTEGVNMQEIWKHDDVLDLRRAYTNNIHSIANTFGIEAAVKSIIKEISSVFNVYGISVDYHHLSLIADYMTFDGTYKPFNRYGLEANSSPLQKMSFETTVNFLRSAAVQGDTDSLSSPSSCLVTGRLVKGGTGSFELLQKLI